MRNKYSFSTQNINVSRETLIFFLIGLICLDLFLSVFKAFLVGGAFCLIGEILIVYTKLTPARILVSFVVSGVLLTAIGLYEPIVAFADAGATVPLTGFGYSLAKGVKTAVEEQGLIGALTGGLTATAGGITASVLFGLLASLIFKSGDKT